MTPGIKYIVKHGNFIYPVNSFASREALVGKSPCVELLALSQFKFAFELADEAHLFMLLLDQASRYAIHLEEAQALGWELY